MPFASRFTIGRVSRGVALDMSTPILTKRQHDFVAAVLDGKTYSDAYRMAYDTKASAKTVHEEASRVASNPKVAQVLASYRERAAVGAMWSYQKAVERLSNVNNQCIRCVVRDGIIDPVALNGFVSTAKELNKITRLERQADAILDGAIYDVEQIPSREEVEAALMNPSKSIKPGDFLFDERLYRYAKEYGLA